MNIEANKAIIRKYAELWSTGNLALADEVLAANFVDHTHPNQAPGPESVKQEVKTFRDGFPDTRITIERMISEGDIVAFRFALRETHLGRFAGFPPMGKAFMTFPASACPFFSGLLSADRGNALKRFDAY